MKKCFCLLLTLLCISYSAVAAPGFRIKGKIVDANNNQPIDFADVLLFREGDVNPVFHALPDPDGTFRIADVKDGKYNLLVRLVGYDLYNRPGIVLDAVSKAVDLGTIADRLSISWRIHPPYVWMPKVKSVFVEVPVSRSM